MSLRRHSSGSSSGSGRSNSAPSTSTAPPGSKTSSSSDRASKPSSSSECLYDRLLREGVSAKYKQRTQDALSLLSKAIALRPDHYECYLQKALAYFSVDQRRLAIEYLNVASAKCSRTMTASQRHTLRGLLIELVDKDFPSALHEYEVAVAEDPLNDFAHNAIGFICHMEHEYERAIRHYLDAVSSGPKYGLCVMLCNIGLCYENLENEPKTVEYYTLAIIDNPEYLEAYLYRAQFYSDHARPDDALSDLRSVLHLHPHHSLATALMGDVYFDTRREDEALEMYRRANLFDPLTASYYEILASWQLYKFRDADGAFRILEGGIRVVVLDHEVQALWKAKGHFAKFLLDKFLGELQAAIAKRGEEGERKREEKQHQHHKQKQKRRRGNRKRKREDRSRSEEAEEPDSDSDWAEEIDVDVDYDFDVDVDLVLLAEKVEKYRRLHQLVLSKLSRGVETRYVARMKSKLCRGRLKCPDVIVECDD